MLTVNLSPPSLSCLAMCTVHTMDELKLTGNCLLGSRPLLSFDPVSVTTCTGTVVMLLTVGWCTVSV